MANTPFLDLVKPAGTDHALVSVINSNSDKIDGGVSTLSEQIAIYDFGTKSLSEFESALNTYVNNNMSNGQTKSISVSFSPASSPFGANLYMGDVKKLNSTRTRVELRRATSIDTVVGAANNGTWTWDILETRSDADSRVQAVLKSYGSLAGGESVEISSLAPAYVYLLILSSSSDARTGLYIIFGRSTSYSTYIYKVAGGNDITVTGGTSKITISNTSNTSTEYRFINIDALR